MDEAVATSQSRDSQFAVFYSAAFRPLPVLFLCEALFKVSYGFVPYSHRHKNVRSLLDVRADASKNSCVGPYAICIYIYFSKNCICAYYAEMHGMSGDLIT